MVSAERNPPIEEVISQGVIPRFVQFLQRQDAPQLQVNSCRVAVSCKYSADHTDNALRSLRRPGR